MSFDTSLEADKETTMPAARHCKVLFPEASNSHSQVFVTWVKQMVETVTPGTIAKEGEESSLPASVTYNVRVTVRQEHSMSVHTSTSVCDAA